MTKCGNLFFLLILIIIIKVNISNAEIYVYVDKRGVYHYTNVPSSPKYKPLNSSYNIKKHTDSPIYRPKNQINSKLQVNTRSLTTPQNNSVYYTQTSSSSQYGTLYITMKDSEKGTYKINSQSGVIYKPKTQIIQYSYSGSPVFYSEKKDFYLKDYNYYDYAKNYFISPHKYEKFIKSASYTFALDPSLIKAVIHAESAGRPDAVSPKGAMGLMQLMPGTAKDMAVSNPFDPEDNIWGGARYLREMLDRFNGDVRLALAAYNAGPGAVEKNNGIPPYEETQQYVKKVISLWKQYKESSNTIN